MTFSLSICKAIVISVSFFFLFRISVSSFVAFWNALIPWKNVDGQKSINKRIVKIPTLLSMRSVCHFVPFLCISLSFKKKKKTVPDCFFILAFYVRTARIFLNLGEEKTNPETEKRDANQRETCTDTLHMKIDEESRAKFFIGFTVTNTWHSISFTSPNFL